MPKHPVRQTGEDPNDPESWSVVGVDRKPPKPAPAKEPTKDKEPSS